MISKRLAIDCDGVAGGPNRLLSMVSAWPKGTFCFPTPSQIEFVMVSIQADVDQGLFLGRW